MITKALSLTIALSVTVIYCVAQDVVKWSFSSKKLSKDRYEIHITAKIAELWHIYSQSTPELGSFPTTISFTKNPLVTLVGKPKEVGKMLTKYEEISDVHVKYYQEKVSFVQTVIVKKVVNTMLTGSIEFMACTNQECLPPETVKFSIPL